jgi:hypothetical protein
MVGEGPARDLEAIKVDLDPSSELSTDTTRHVDRYATQLVVVAVPRYHQGGHVALTLRRRLAGQIPVALVTEPSDSPFGNVDDWRAPATGTGVRVFSVAQCGYDPKELAANRLVERLARGLYDADPPQPGRAWVKAGEAARQNKRDDARTLYDELARDDVPLHRSAAVALSSTERALVEALGVPPDALPLAGLRVDFTAPEALVTAVKNLPGPHHAFEAWCEVARLRAVAAELAADHPAGAPEDVDRLLRLRCAALGDAAAKASLPSLGTIPVDRRVVVLIGDPPGGCRARVATLLEPALGRVADPPRVFHAGDPAVAHALGPGVTSVPSTAGTARGRALDLWTAIVKRNGKPADVRVLLLPGAPADEILLARALDTRIGRPWWSGEPDTDTDSALLGGAAGLVPLPADRMIIRAFLHQAAAQPWREQVAGELHRRYVSHQRERKRGDDPALRPYSRLLPWLRESNLAMADDIVNKLAEVGLQVVPDPTVAADQGWPASVTDADRERLAEMEHGRFAAERIQNGWAAAPRDLDRLMSPHLVPWAELTEAIKNYDREAIADLPQVLAAVGLKLRPA